MNAKNAVEEAVNDFRKGRFVIIVDDEKRENEGDLVFAAEKATPEKINFMIKNCRGLICVPLGISRIRELKLKPMVPLSQNTEKTKCNFTVSVDSREAGTGISAFDRCITIKHLADSSKKANDFCRPGHIFPLIPASGGVLERPGHTEAGIEMCRLAGLYPAAVICEIIHDNGRMARLPELRKFSKKHGIKIVSIAQIAKFINQNKIC